MEITLEKIELVKDRTGVTYKEAKEALEKSDGNVVDAIISIEENLDINFKDTTDRDKAAIMEKLKEIVKKGNVSKIVFKKDGDTILNLPVNAGIIGAAIAPWAAIAGLAAALVIKCQIEVIKDNGEIIDVSEFTNDKFGDLRQKGADVMEDMKGKAEDMYSNVKSKMEDTVNKKKENKEEAEEDDFYPDEEEDELDDLN